jgi:cytohesin
MFRLSYSRTDSEVMEWYLRHGADANARDSIGQPILLEVASSGTAETIQALLRHGARVNERSHQGATALQHAVSSHNIATARALLAAGANPTTGGRPGFTPLDYARRWAKAEPKWAEFVTEAEGSKAIQTR